MKKMICILIPLLSFIVNAHCMSGDDSLLVMFWNLENFFDHTDGGAGESDTEFSSYGSRHWTRKRFYVKCDAVAKAIFWIAGRYGRMPDLIGLAEIENRAVLERLLNHTLLRKHDYRIVHHDSGDRRGIDVAILYRDSSMDHLSTSVITPEIGGKKMDTRDILHVGMSLSDSCRIDFIVNHHPSKYGGDEESSDRRKSAMTSLKNLCDSLGNESVIAMGDFNDVPDASSFEIIEGTLENKGRDLHEKGEGTIRYEGRWQLIDMFMVSPSLSLRTEMEICPVPFLMVRERKHPGLKPFRTYSGPRYIGGVSDHCPVVLTVK